MRTDTRDIFVLGLQNAHAVENQALSIMAAQLQRLADYPELAARLEQHVAETKRQVARLEELMGRLGEASSSLKDVTASAMGSAASMAHMLAGDEILKNTFADFAFENYEIAAYRSLVQIASAGGFDTAVPLLNDSLEEEQSMASWLAEHIPSITQRYVQLQTATT